MPSVTSTLHSLSVNYYYRRALLHTPLYRQPSEPRQPATGIPVSDADGGASTNGFDANVVMILAVLLCALICALGLNSIVRCALRCSNRMVNRPEPNHATRLAQTGLPKKALRAMPAQPYSVGLKLHATNPECAICLSDFEPGERIRVLPKCNHGFHVRCIDRWLLAHSSCPTCRRGMSGMQQKSSGCSEMDRPRPDPVQAILVPLEPEGFNTPYNNL
ncbi:RING-H2 finger protein ATL74-like [Typha angustifolia]|uniref:RING-H2 finger protein ATL74-like n=1 Tax=Typha angustifolia TaxID=59011 RepID=UPI003C2D554F